MSRAYQPDDELDQAVADAVDQFGPITEDVKANIVHLLAAGNGDAT